MKRVLILILIIFPFISLASKSKVKKETFHKYNFQNVRNELKNDFIDNKSEFENEFYNSLDSIVDDFDDFRKSSIEDFAKFARKPWIEISQAPKYARPIQDRIMQDFVSIDERDIESVHDEYAYIGNAHSVISVHNEQPIDGGLSFKLFGTTFMVRFPPFPQIELQQITEGRVADAISVIDTVPLDDLLSDCFEIRNAYNLCDWAYLLMLQALTETVFTNLDTQKLMYGILLLESGYKVRLATDSSNLFILIGSNYLIYDVPVYDLDGELFYCFDTIPHNIRICPWRHPDEKPLNLSIVSPPKFSEKKTSELVYISKKYPQMNISLRVNLNLMDFYSTYPPAEGKGGSLERWAIYANTRISENVSCSLYDQLGRILDGESEVEAVSMLLDWIQTGFKYEIDNKVWGHERIFFPEETLYHSYSDCEDRAILFTRIVRDLLHLDCVLVYYPGHIAAAVKFDSDIEGDCIMVDGCKYIIADPTYSNGSIGVSIMNVNADTVRTVRL